MPLYLVVQLGLSPLAFGTLDGLYNGFGAVTRLAGGVAVDRWRWHKQLAAVGYAMSGLCRLGLLVVGRWWLGLPWWWPSTASGRVSAPCPGMR